MDHERKKYIKQIAIFCDRSFQVVDSCDILMQKHSLPAENPSILYIDLNTPISAGEVKAGVIMI